VLQWSDLFAAVALFLVLEGLAPFVSPAATKRRLAEFLKVPDAQLRIAGLASCIAGVLLLIWVRS
jgi:uncharacterized protein